LVLFEQAKSTPCRYNMPNLMSNTEISGRLRRL
jgi:hypothetical protein